MERDKNGYAVVKVGTRKFIITPYNEFFAVRDVRGSIVRVPSTGQQLIFRTEEAAQEYVKGV